MEQAVDQSSDSARVTTWKYNMLNKVPVVLIVGMSNCFVSNGSLLILDRVTQRPLSI